MYLSFDEWCEMNKITYELIPEDNLGEYEIQYIYYCENHNLVSDLDDCYRED